MLNLEQLKTGSYFWEELFLDKTHLWWSGHVSKQKCSFKPENNPPQTEVGVVATLSVERYRLTLKDILRPVLDEFDFANKWFNKTVHTSYN